MDDWLSGNLALLVFVSNQPGASLDLLAATIFASIALVRRRPHVSAASRPLAAERGRRRRASLRVEVQARWELDCCLALWLGGQLRPPLAGGCLLAWLR
jgi:hypothetical protein